MTDNESALVRQDGATPANAAMVRQGFGETTAISGIEAQAQALAAQVKAAVEARYILAMRRPRHLETVATKLKAECRRPRFADEARYSVPRGRKQNAKGEWEDNMVEGPSIRFAEAAVRAMGNIDTTTMVVYDDASTRQVRVTAIDLESNVTYSKDITVSKTQERKKLREGQVPIGERYNSAGQRVFIVATPDSELQNVQAAAESKALRTLILRLVPGDITEDCMDVCVAILRDVHAKDPQAAVKALCDGFYRLGVQPVDLVTYLGHPLDQMTPAEYQHLRSLGIALRDGQTSWTEALEAKMDGREIKAPDAPKTSESPAVPAQEQAAPAAPAEAPAASGPRAKGSRAVAGQVKAQNQRKEQAAAPQATIPGPGSPEWEAAKNRAAKVEPAPAPDPHGDPPPPDDVPLPGQDDHPAGEGPDWMA